MKVARSNMHVFKIVIKVPPKILCTYNLEICDIFIWSKNATFASQFSEWFVNLTLRVAGRIGRKREMRIACPNMHVITNEIKSPTENFKTIFLITFLVLRIYNVGKP